MHDDSRTLPAGHEPQLLETSRCVAHESTQRTGKSHGTQPGRHRETRSSETRRMLCVEQGAGLAQSAAVRPAADADPFVGSPLAPPLGIVGPRARLSGVCV